MINAYAADVLGMSLNYDSTTGSILNIEQFQAEVRAKKDFIIDEYNKLITELNAQEDEELKEQLKEEADTWKKTQDALVEKTEELFAQYQETAQKIADEVAAQVDQIYEWLALKIEAITYLRDLRVGINKTDIDIINLALKAVGKSADAAQKNLQAVVDTISELNENSTEI